MAFSRLDSEILDAREAYLQLRGYLADKVERDALDGVYNSIKSPQRLLVEDPNASVDQKCESLEQMVAVLHRVRDLLRNLIRRSCRRTGVGNYSLDALLTRLAESEGFLYFDHFTSAAKHTSYIPRGVAGDIVFIDEFSYSDYGDVDEPRRSSDEIVEMAREVIRLAAQVVRALSHTLEESRTWDPKESYVCATPIHDPNLYAVRPDSADAVGASIEQAHPADFGKR